MEIITLRNEGLRGQAFVIFAAVSTATAALQAEQNFTFFGKNLKIDYANEKSDRIAKRDGTFVPKDRRRVKKEPKREREREDGIHINGNINVNTDININGNGNGNGNGNQEEEIAKRRKLDHVNININHNGGETMVDGVRVENTSTLIKKDDHTAGTTTIPNNYYTNNNNPSSTTLSTDDAVPTMDDAHANAHTHVHAHTHAAPSNILFAESLPKDCNEMMLSCLFRSYPGFKEVRIPRSGLAFVEFDDEPHASVALKALNGFNLSAAETLNLKYGKA